MPSKAVYRRDTLFRPKDPPFPAAVLALATLASLQSPCKRGLANGQKARGWQLELEKEKGEEADLEKGKDSSLATALLGLWSHGKLSAVTIRWLAECAMFDGADHPELASMASAGSHGAHRGNVHRDIASRFCNSTGLPAFGAILKLDGPCFPFMG